MKPRMMASPEEMSGESMPPQQGQQAGVDPDTEVFETMVAGLTKHMFGAGEESIKKQLAQATDLADEIGSITFVMVEQAAEQATSAGVEFDMDIIMGVATEMIDNLIQMADAMGLDTGDEDDLREQSIIFAVQKYLTVANPSEEEREAAQQMLAQMTESGEVGEAAAEIQRIGQKNGVDPFAEPVDGGGQGAQPQPGPKPALMQE